MWIQIALLALAATKWEQAKKQRQSTVAVTQKPFINPDVIPGRWPGLRSPENSVPFWQSPSFTVINPPGISDQPSGGSNPTVVATLLPGTVAQASSPGSPGGGSTSPSYTTTGYNSPSGTFAGLQS